jgi:hypothetical protein
VGIKRDKIPQNGVDTKSRSLLNALEIGFAEMQKMGAIAIGGLDDVRSADLLIASGS